MRSPAAPAAEPAADIVASLLARALAAFALALVAATWPLWTLQRAVPAVPFIRLAQAVPDTAQWIAAAAALTGLLSALVAPRGNLWATRGLLAFVAGTALLVLCDQQRFQPWVYQFLLVALALAWAEARTALWLVRVLVISFYFYSAVTKLDFTFLHTLGQQFLAALAGLFGASLDGWSETARLWAAAVFPLGELAVALGLCFARTRRAALGGAIALHVLLLVILGPWGLNHKPGVLLWNAYFIVQDVLLFGPAIRPLASVNAQSGLRTTWLTAPKPLLAVFAGAVLLPLLAPTSWFDLWPSWGLYAPSSQRLTLWVHRRAAGELPPELASFLDEERSDDPAWLAVRLDRWTLESLRAPIYPQNRYQLALAESIVRRAGLDHRARVVMFSMANRVTGHRDAETLAGAAQISAACDRYLLNARANER